MEFRHLNLAHDRALSQPFSKMSEVARGRGGDARVIAGLDTPGRACPTCGGQRCADAREVGQQDSAAQNRKARFNYQIGETFEAGIALTGT
jgi:SmpB protein